MTEPITIIDGSQLEGGGQILRIALSLSALCSKPIKVINIRAGRPKPGLMAQHLNGIQILEKICNANVKGTELGSTCIEFYPNKIKSGQYFADTKTAGSVGLILQVALPCCYFSNGQTILKLRGGTNAEMAPQIDYTTEVFRPILEKFGATFDFDLLKRGYFPRGGGEVEIIANPIKEFKPINLTNLGSIVKIFGWSFAAGQLPIKVAHIIADTSRDHLLKHLQKSKHEINIERYKEAPDIAPDTCSGINLVCETSTGCVIGGTSLGKKNKRAEDVGLEAAQQIIDTINANACVDSYSQDQVIIFMALANGESKIKIGKITLHTETAIYVAQRLTKAVFKIEKINNESNIITCQGIGLKNIN